MPQEVVKHADLIRAALDGKTIQYITRTGEWVDYGSATVAIEHMLNFSSQYRVKPETVVLWVPVVQGVDLKHFIGSAYRRRDLLAAGVPWLIRVELDVKTGYPLSLSAEKP
jgi:hypothetical protein